MRQWVQINSAIALDPLTVDSFSTEVRKLTKELN